MGVRSQELWGNLDFKSNLWNDWNSLPLSTLKKLLLASFIWLLKKPLWKIQLNWSHKKIFFDEKNRFFPSDSKIFLFPSFEKFSQSFSKKMILQKKIQKDFKDERINSFILFNSQKVWSSNVYQKFFPDQGDL